MCKGDLGKGFAFQLYVFKHRTSTSVLQGSVAGWRIWAHFCQVHSILAQHEEMFLIWTVFIVMVVTSTFISKTLSVRNCFSPIFPKEQGSPSTLTEKPK